MKIEKRGKQTVPQEYNSRPFHKKQTLLKSVQIEGWI